MKIYWTFNQIPELRDLPWDQRYRVWQACCDTSKFRVINVFAVLSVIVVVFWLIFQVKMLSSTAQVLIYAISMGITHLIVSRVQLERHRPSIREYLKEHEHGHI
jgi:hypothetical protein